MSAERSELAKPKRHRFLIILILVVVPITAFLGISVARSLTNSALIESRGFPGIKPLEKATTSIIIVHGIGHHCIGYADELISNLLYELSGSTTETIQQSYVRYAEALRYHSPEAELVSEPDSDSDGYQVDMIEPLRDGNCKRVKLPNDIVADRQVNTGEDLESVVIAEDKLCRFINEAPKAKKTKAYCHKLYVNRLVRHERKENLEYVTGFVRRFDKDISSVRRVRIYEVTWSPATRWIKQSLRDVETFNDAMSNHWLNRFLKSEIVNAGVADAVAYLSDSGMLVNYNLLQAFCLTFANENADRSTYTGYGFSCQRSHLEGSTEVFSQENDIFLISHSLGTRILFDSIGLLARGVKNEKDTSVPAPPDLAEIIGSRFHRIGAAFPQDEPGALALKPDFVTLLTQRIPEFARAIRSVYVFTNQVPLLAANLSSPFNESYGVGDGFKEFLDLHGTRSGSATKSPLPVVVFHDPDDFLSYNLSCWYYETILKNLPETRNRLEKEAQFRASRDKSMVGDERRQLGNTMFGKNCSKRELVNQADISLFDDIWGQKSNLLALMDATVRLKAYRVEWIAADPLGVHSNYFYDKAVHRWLVYGHSGT